ncbi:MAG TPA: terminase gpA endonuclease subunit [Desulfatiglandales bacterium]|nr:terminase gpA endonuclease subunit [Desulfatiglandales bacterium]
MKSKIELWPEEQSALSPPEPLNVSGWANKNIVLLPETAREPGPYRWQRTPYARDIMNLYKHPDIHHIVLKWGTQLGKSVILYNILGYAIDQDPYSTLLIYPSDDEGKTVSRTRIQPLIEASQALRKKKPKDTKKYQLDELHFPGMVLYIAGSNSPTPLSQKPCRNIFRDEINKWPSLIGDYGDPMDLSEERFKSFFDIRKVIDVSSPTTEHGNITKQEALCQVILKYYVSCPFCQRLQTLEWEGIKFENRQDLDMVSRIHLAKSTARYECKFCHKQIDDTYKEWMLNLDNGAGWFDMNIKEPEPVSDSIAELFKHFEELGIKLESVAARLPSFYSPWLRWGDIVGKFLEAHLSTFKRFDKLRAFTTDWKAEEWVDKIEEKSENDILALRCEYPPLTVPPQAVVLTCGVDCQKDGFYFVVRAWAKDYTSWLIRYGFLLEWEDIFRLIYEDSYPIEGNPEKRMKLWRAAIDTGGGQDGDMSLTERAYRFIAQYGGGGTFGVKGASREMVNKMKLTLIGTLPGSRNTPIPGGSVRLWIVDTAYFKDVFHARMQIKDGDPGAIYLHSETGLDYANQIVAEEKRRQKDGRYKWVHVRGQNHFFDAEIYCNCLVDPVCYGGLGVIPSAEKPKEKERPRPESRSNWLSPPSRARWMDIGRRTL